MKLDTRALRYLTAEDWRVLTAVEMGSRNHEVVPTNLIAQLSGLRGGSGVHKSISNLAKVKLIGKVKNAKCETRLQYSKNAYFLLLTLYGRVDDGYRLTYGGLDYLSLHTYQKQKSVYSVGNQIGVGKESDIFVVADNTGTQRVLKIHRLGRISFRTVKANRDYLRNRSSGSWMYMSRLAALKEYNFMKALKENGFPVPDPLAQNRHTLLMSLVDAFPLRQISSVPDPSSLYAELIDLIMKLASYGLIHGDFNEFNILIEEKVVVKDSTAAEFQPEKGIILNPVLIDFPQMVSIDHTNAEMYFDRDVDCIKRFFERKFHFKSNEPGPFLKEARENVGKAGTKRLDVEVEASGFSKKMAKDLETYMREMGVDGDNGVGRNSENDESDPESEDQDGDGEDIGAEEGDPEPLTKDDTSHVKVKPDLDSINSDMCSMQIAGDTT
ncbi:MAG: hypothetical protein M1834_007610 [Cirrosporium novae-zelandiae]|nr:MAG: hypothetical protein M1834_007610 [Cirrosporium novae-zelandiae]